jgi:hypothetical protein
VSQRSMQILVDGREMHAALILDLSPQDATVLEWKLPL